jgi:subtilisin-like proprotein convertase family protein
MEETAEKYRTLKKLNYLIMKLNSLRSASIQFDVPQKYMPDLVARLEPPAGKQKT